MVTLCVISSLVLWLLKCAACSLLSFVITIFHSLNRSKELQLKIPEVLLLSKFERWPPGNKRQVRFKLSTHSLGSKEFKIIGLSVHAAAAHHHHYNHSHLHLPPLIIIIILFLLFFLFSIKSSQPVMALRAPAPLWSHTSIALYWEYLDWSVGTSALLWCIYLVF